MSGLRRRDGRRRAPREPRGVHRPDAGGDHEAWLDEHAPAWADSGPAELADTVVGHATETDAEPVSEAHTHDAPAGARASVDASAADSDDVLAEARELTAAMYAASADDNGDSENE